MNKDSLNNTMFLKKSIEELKYKLNNAIDINNLSLCDVIQLSQELDELIVQYYKSI